MKMLGSLNQARGAIEGHRRLPTLLIDTGAAAARAGRRFTPRQNGGTAAPMRFDGRAGTYPYRAPFRRRRARITVIACHGPPPGNGTSRSFSSRAIARAVMPANSARIGRSNSAR